MSTTIPHLYLHQWIGGVDTVTLAVSDVLNEREPDSVVSRPSSLPAISTELIEELVFLRICEKNKEPSRPIKVGREGELSVSSPTSSIAAADRAAYTFSTVSLHATSTVSENLQRKARRECTTKPSAEFRGAVLYVAGLGPR